MCVRHMPNGRQAPSLTSLAPFKLEDSRPKVYCWHRHAQFVSEWFGQNLCADVSVVAIREPDQMAGLRDIVFVQVGDVDTVNDRYSDALAAFATRCRGTILTIDDSAKRSR